MLGMEDWVVALGWILTVGAMLFGVLYGIVNWNREDGDHS